MPKKYTIRFQCRQYGEAVPPVYQDELEYTEEIAHKSKAHAADMIVVYENDVAIDRSIASPEGAQRLFKRLRQKLIPQDPTTHTQCQT